MVKDAGNSFTQSTRLRFINGVAQFGNTLSETDALDFYRFRLTGSEVLNFALEGVEGNVELSLFDADRQRIAVSNEEDGEAEQIQQPLDQGTYFIRVRHIEGEIEYTLDASTTTVDLEGTSFEEAIEIEKNGSETNLTGTLTYTGEVDATVQQEQFEYYQFTLVDRTGFKGILDRLDANCTFVLYDVNQQVIFTSDRTSTRTERITQMLDAGVYYLRIGSKRQESDYRLRTTFQEVRINGDSLTTAETIELSSTQQTFTGIIGASDRADYYQVELTANGFLNLSLTELQIDANIQILDINGTVVASSTNASTAQELLSTQLSAGIYYISITTISTTITSYTFNYSVDYGGSSLQTATVITVLPTVTTTNEGIGIADTEDVYRFDFSKPGRLNLELNVSSADANLELLDSNGTVIDRSANTGITPEFVNNNLNPGTYYVRVSLADGVVGSTNYQLNYNRYDLPLFALNDDNRLTALDPVAIDQPGKLYAYLDITGLAADEEIREIDFRPGASGSELYGLSDLNKLYLINQTTGAATLVGDSFVSTTGETYGFDVDPTRDRIRVTSEDNENFGVDPLTGTASADSTLFYAADDLNAFADPSVTALAYTNSFVGAFTTTLYGIDTALDTLVQIDSNGIVRTVGSLGVDFVEQTGFDIVTTGSGLNLGYATSNEQVYAIDLTTGAATGLKGVVDSVTQAPYTLIGVAVRPT